MNIKCPHCGTEYEVEKTDMYRYTKCEVCGKGFVAGATTSMLSSDDACAAVEPSTQVPTHKKFTTRREQPARSRGGHVTMPSRFERPQNGATPSAPSATAAKVKSSATKIVITIICVVLGVFLVAGVAVVGGYLYLCDEARLNRGVMRYEKGLYSEAYKLLLPLAEKDFAKAQLLVGDCLAKGQGVVMDTDEAVKWYRLAADKELPEAQYRMFVCCRDGIGMERNLANAAKWCRKAAEAGLEEAMFDMGMLYSNGTGVEENAKSAFRWFRKGAERGYAPALYTFGQCYKLGCGVEKDEDEASKWQNKAVMAWRASADAGNALAMVQLANLYKEGDVVELDKEEAVRWFRRGAELGNVMAQLNLAICYHKGEGVEADQEESARWMLKAAEESADREVQWTMGRYYQEGWGVEKNLVDAVKWFERAANKGLAEAKYSLAMCYMTGEGVQKDEAKAESLLEDASNGGDDDAKKELDRIKSERAAEVARIAREKSEKERKIKILLDVEKEIGERKEHINDILKGRMKGADWLGFDAGKVMMTDAHVSVAEESPLKSVADNLSEKDSQEEIDEAIRVAEKESERLEARLKELVRVKSVYDAKELESRKEMCVSCTGTGSIECARCKGKGEVLVKDKAPCPTCAGRTSDDYDDYYLDSSRKGQVKKQVKCANCRGMGEIRRKCDRCLGKKKVAFEEPKRLRRYELCGSCRGSGIGEPERCPRCDGNKNIDIWQTCATCKGSGVVTNGTKITCPVCDGRGKLVCERCGGKGHTYRPKNERK